MSEGMRRTIPKPQQASSPKAKTGEAVLSTPTTPSRGPGSGSEAPSPLSKANTPQRGGVFRVVCLDDDAAAAVADAPLRSSVTAKPAVSEKCSLLGWVAHAHRESMLQAERDAVDCPIRAAEESTLCQKRVNKSWRAKTARLQRDRARWFGEYSEDEPDQYLLMQDLISLHRRGVEDVSVTILTDDEPFDVEPLVGHAGMSDLDAAHLMDSADDVLASYSPETPDDWLLYQDLVSLSRKGASRVSVTMLLDEDEDKIEDIQIKSESGLGNGHSSEELVGGAVGACGVGLGGVVENAHEADMCGDFEYDEEDPEVRLRSTHVRARTHTHTHTP